MWKKFAKLKNLLARIIIVLSLLAISTTGLAQGSGTVTGRVLDQSGAVIPGVSVQFVPAATQMPVEAFTDVVGTYRFVNVPTGPGELMFRLINFSAVRRDIVVMVGAGVTDDVVMIVATSADITITASRTFKNLADLENPRETLVGIANAGSEGAITAAQLAVRPINRATEILETVPGMVISQHSGEGKANQYYLRGFNLDHGFDFSQTVAGVPVNMPSHAHSQGYADSNFLIPELVSGVQFRKGPYYAENGDFSSAGSANINYSNVLNRPIVKFSSGSYGFLRFLGAASPRVGSGHLLAAVEYEKDEGPWESPNGLDKYNGVLQYSQGDARNGLSVTVMGYANHWHSTDQIPRRAVESGLIDRFGFIEETDGGETYRYVGSLDWQQSSINNSTRVLGYTQRYGVQLFHNFTYFLNDPVNGDQFEQFEERWTTGGKLTHWRMARVGGKPSESAFGVDFRHDSVGGPLGLYLTRATERLSTGRADEVDQFSVGFFGQTEIEWSRVTRVTFGLRGDVYHWDVMADNPLNSGTKTSGIMSPKVSAAFGPWSGTELYANWGLGFHSNSALGIMLTADPFTSEEVSPSPAFARSHGVEFGVRTVAVPRLQATATAWYLDFDSELIYVGDSGRTVDGPGTRRFGFEVSNYFYPNSWTTLDLDVSFSRARFIDVPVGGRFVPGALNRVVAGGVTVNPPAGVIAGPFGSIRLRHFGPRALLEDNSIKSESTTFLNTEIGHKFSERFRLILEGFNILDAEASDIDYYFESRLRDELEPISDVHFHAAIPRSYRLALQITF